MCLTGRVRVTGASGTAQQTGLLATEPPLWKSSESSGNQVPAYQEQPPHWSEHWGEAPGTALIPQLCDPIRLISNPRPSPPPRKTMKAGGGFAKRGAISCGRCVEGGAARREHWARGPSCFGDRTSGRGHPAGSLLCPIRGARGLSISRNVVGKWDPCSSAAAPEKYSSPRPILSRETKSRVGATTREDAGSLAYS